MKNLVLSFLVFLGGFLSLNAQNAATSHPDLYEVVHFLASDELKGRMVGSEHEGIAAKYIATKMEIYGLTPKGTYGYYQEYSVTTKDDPHAIDGTPKEGGETFESKNVVGFIDNGAAYTIVIGAHYDHLGMGGFSSLYAGKDSQIHNGADDNASGVALLLSLAKEISLNKNQYNHHNYLFIAFSGEEKGLWGSSHYAKNPTLDLDKVNYMINFDMVGRLDTSRGLAINGVGTSPFWEEAIQKANTNDLTLVTSESGVGPSDHTSFYLEDLPVLHFFTGQHEDYHKPSDDADKINYEGIALVGDMVKSLLNSSKEAVKIEFTKTKDNTQTRATFKVTLGIMPDYMYQDKGMKIDGVTEDRPAFNAGLERGDIVVKIGKLVIDGMDDYMKALGEFEPGEKTTIQVIRDGKTIKKSLTF